MSRVSRAERRRQRMAAFRTRFVRTPLGRALRFLPWTLQLALLVTVAIAIPAGVGSLLVDQVQRVRYGNQRITRVETALIEADPARGSAYCRGNYGDGPLYAACLVGETQAHRQFSAAWAHGKDLSTLREQMLTCFSAGQEVQGISWQTAAKCAEADMPIPGETPGS